MMQANNEDDVEMEPLLVGGGAPHEEDGEVEDEDVVDPLEENGVDEEGEALPVRGGGRDARPGEQLRVEDECETYCTEMLNRIGVGRYQCLVLLLCGLANASDAIELMSISFFISSTAQCDLNLTPENKAAITAAVFVGMIPGGLTFGLLADRSGRRLWLGTGLAINSLGMLISSQASTFVEFLFWRIVSGFGVGGSIPVLFAFAVEFAPVESRGKMLVTVAFFWVVGTVICASLAWIILGTNSCQTRAQWLDTHNSTDLYCASIADTGCGKINGQSAWRVFMGSCCAPALLTACMLCFAHESPTWLVNNNLGDRAKCVLRRIAEINRRNVVIDDPPRNLDNREAMLAGVRGYLAIAKRTFTPPNREQFLWLCGVWFFLSFGFYGFRLWMTEVFAEDAVSDIYAASFYVALATIPGYVAAGKTVDSLGRKSTLILSMALTGVFVFAILGAKNLRNEALELFFSCTFAAVSAGAWCGLDVLSVERFPTAIRSSTLAMLTVIGRLAAIFGNLFWIVARSDHLVPLLLSGIAFVAGAWCCRRLPHVNFAAD